MLAPGVYNVPVVQMVRLEGFRGLSGAVELAPGLNILLGPNASGKTSIIEAIFTAAAVNYTDLRLTNSLVTVLHASRGSVGHSMASQVSGREASTCIRVAGVEGAEDACTKITVSRRLESRGMKLHSVVEVAYTGSRRDCTLIYEVYDPVGAIRLEFRGECTTSGMRVGLLTSGVIPYNYLDAIVGEMKAREPETLEALVLEVGGRRYDIDVASDEWGGIAAYIREDGGRPIVFYSMARGLQRAFQLLLQLRLNDVMLIDEFEAAMHPELLSKVADAIAREARRGKQVIVATHSLEAVYMLVAALLGDVEAWRRQDRLMELLDSACQREEDKLERLYAIHILNREGNAVKALSLRGCAGLSYTLGVRDPRLSYRVVTSGGET